MARPDPVDATAKRENELELELLTAWRASLPEGGERVVKLERVLKELPDNEIAWPEDEVEVKLVRLLSLGGLPALTQPFVPQLKSRA